MQLVELSIDGWSTVINVHGAAGHSGWQQLCPGFARHGPWEAVEAARLPQGGVSGVHRHSRTNEIYFILAPWTAAPRCRRTARPAATAAPTPA